MATLYEFCHDTGNASNISATTNWRGQTFTVALSHNINTVKLRTFRTGNPGTITVQVYPVSSEDGLPIDPTGSSLTSGNYDGNAVGTSAQPVVVSLTTVALVAGAKYCIIWTAQFASDPNTLIQHVHSGLGAGTYSNGNYIWSNNNKTTWAGSNFDHWFEEGTDLTVDSATVTCQAITNITSTTATGHGNITALGDYIPTQHGHCWNTTGTPTTADSKTQNGAPSVIGTFTSSITGLTAGTTYYVRAYVTDSQGTVYSNQVTLKTLALVTQSAVTNIVTTTATGHGVIQGLGTSPTQHGHCWNTNGSPTTSDSKTSNGVPVLGAFTSALTGLTAGTLYYVRAYITNTEGTSYSNQVTFTAAKGTVSPVDTLLRVTGITRTFWAGQGGNAVYQMQVTQGGVTPEYFTPIKPRTPQPLIPDDPITKGQYSPLYGAEYSQWLITGKNISVFLQQYKRFPTYEDWFNLVKK